MLIPQHSEAPLYILSLFGVPAGIGEVQVCAGVPVLGAEVNAGPQGQGGGREEAGGPGARWLQACLAFGLGLATPPIHGRPVPMFFGVSVECHCH